MINFFWEFITSWDFRAFTRVIFCIPGQVVFHPSMDVDGPLFGLSILNLLNYFHHWFLQPLSFSQLKTLFVFLGSLSLTHFFSYFNFCGNINIDHIHIWNDCLCQQQVEPLLQPHIWHAYEDVLCGFWFGCVASMVVVMVCFFFSTCFHIVIHHPCVIFVNFPCIIMCFH